MIPSRHTLLAALPLALASCALPGPAATRPATGPVAASATLPPDPTGSRRQQYIPPASALLHREYDLVYQPSVRMMDRRWPGRVAEVIGDEVWTWRQEVGGRVYEGEALVRNHRPIDGYVLRVRDQPDGR